MACTAVHQETIPKTRNGNILFGTHRILILEDFTVLPKCGAAAKCRSFSRCKLSPHVERFSVGAVI